MLECCSDNGLCPSWDSSCSPASAMEGETLPGPHNVKHQSPLQNTPDTPYSGCGRFLSITFTYLYLYISDICVYMCMHVCMYMETLFVACLLFFLGELFSVFMVSSQCYLLLLLPFAV